jgi:1-acyl-sn-glycerol-3-phosphate acyltransferase
VVNHTSALDIVVLFGWLPANLRFIYKSSLTRLPFVGWSLPLNGHISVNRSNPFSAKRSLEMAARQLSRGLGIVAFPEGTRSHDESLRRFKRGPFALAIESQVPVVPVSLAGVRGIVGGGVRGFRPGEIRLLVHPPLSTQGRTTEDAIALAETARQVVEAGCQRA